MGVGGWEIVRGGSGVMGSSISDVSTRRKEGTGWPMIVSCQVATYDKSAWNIFLSGASTSSSLPFISQAGDNNCNAKKICAFLQQRKNTAAMRTVRTHC